MADISDIFVALNDNDFAVILVFGIIYLTIFKDEGVTSPLTYLDITAA